MMGGSLSLAEAAARLSCSADEVREALQAGRFPGRFLVSGRIRIPSVEVESAVLTWSAQPGPVRSTSLERSEVERWMRDVLVAERRSLMRDLEASVGETQARLEGLEEEVAGLRASLRSLGAGEGQWTSSVETSVREGDGVGRLIREISELEDLLEDYSGRD